VGKLVFRPGQKTCFWLLSRAHQKRGTLWARQQQLAISAKYNFVVQPKETTLHAPGALWLQILIEGSSVLQSPRSHWMKWHISVIWTLRAPEPSSLHLLFSGDKLVVRRKETALAPGGLVAGQPPQPSTLMR